jgi:alginate O-acetyltransferase complex protein AlgI
MIFNSFSFLFVFLPAVLILYLMAKPRLENLLLLAAGLVFYAWGEKQYTLIFLLFILSNYFFGRILMHYQASQDKRPGKILITVFIILNLSFLAGFKYSAFIINNINSLLADGPALKLISSRGFPNLLQKSSTSITLKKRKL